MSGERAAMIAAIRESPEEDGPRLVCADWFEEQGDEASVARAEFIRTQIDRANLPPDDARQSELQARELRLLKRYAPIWCGAHFAFKKVLFRRGFIDYVHLHLQHFLHHRRQLLALEPVRDVRLTGWYRATADLVRHVADCEEWNAIETLRIHHQGPHKDPRSEVIHLLESSHLARLRALHCTCFTFDADARRRFERLPVLRNLQELRFPTLDTLMAKPGEWFSDSRDDFAERCQELKSLALPWFLPLSQLRRFIEMPFWERLTSLELVLPYETSAALALLRDNLPKSLRRLCIYAGHSPADYSAAESFFDRLASTPLEALQLKTIPIPEHALARLLDGKGRCTLQELSLRIGCDIRQGHARVLAESPNSSSIRSLSVSSDWRFGEEAAQVLFASETLRSLVHLDLSDTRIGRKGTLALARAKELSGLRALVLWGTNVDNAGLRALLASPNLHNLTSLSLSETQARGDPSLGIDAATAAELIRLPHLAQLRLGVSHCDPQIKGILYGSESLAWIALRCYDEWSIQADRAADAPERWPPVEDSLEPQRG